MIVVAHNLTAMNAQRQFNITDKKKAKNVEKLSSGYKINRSADDAAGLSISEKMRNQIRNLNQSVENIEDGINLTKTADSALSEIHNIIKREKELLVKAANEIYDEDDIQSIQDELYTLGSEVDKIFDTTQFNGMYIFKAAPTKISDGDLHTETRTTETTVGPEVNREEEVVWVLRNGDSPVNTNNEYNVHYKTQRFTTPETGKAVFKKRYDNYSESTTYTEIADGSDRYNELMSNPDNAAYAVSMKPYLKTVTTSKTIHNTTIEDVTVGSTPPVYEPYVFHLQTGANSGESLGIELDYYSASRFYLDTPESLGAEFTRAITALYPSDSLEQLNYAEKGISEIRSKFGALTNRLEYAANSNRNYSENLQGSESNIRDTDMAKEAMDLAKHGILQQAGQSMMAQANQQNQGILQLLQS